MSLNDYLSPPNIISILALVVAVSSVVVAIRSFKRTTTLQTETFILNAYKDYMETMLEKESEQYKTNTKTRFLMAIDLYCKYVVNGHLDKRLSDDNLNFYKEVILLFKDDIKQDIEGYNNIADYAKKYKIPLE